MEKEKENRFQNIAVNSQADKSQFGCLYVRFI